MALHAGDTYFRIAKSFSWELILLDPRMAILNQVGNWGSKDFKGVRRGIIQVDGGSGNDTVFSKV